MSFFALKTVAVLSMLFDHVYHLFHLELFDQPLEAFGRWAAESFPGPVGDALSWFAGFLILALPYLGRIAAPIFLFCIANGYRHTRSVKRYAQRIFLFGALAQIPYFLYLKAWEARLGEELYTPLNFMFTLGLGLLSIALYEREKEQNPSLALLAAFLPIAAAEFFRTEGGGMYAMLVPAFYLTMELPLQKRAVIWMLFFPVAQLGYWIWLFQGPITGPPLAETFLYAVGPCLGVAVALFYNGEKGHATKTAQYGVYALYPVHFLVLALLGFWMAS